MIDKQPSPSLYFEQHPVRAKSISWIELFYPCGHTGQIKPLSHVKGLKHHGERPIAFKWHNPGACTINQRLIEWIYTDFIHIFSYDAFKWKISKHTAPKELQCHLTGPNNN